MTATDSPLWQPLLALDRLNSWLRAGDDWRCDARSSLKRVIYWTKTHAILNASKQIEIGMRRVMVKKPCRKCDGTGIWVPWDWSPSGGDYSKRDGGEACRGCNATGTATLRFIETVIGSIKWHTPAEKWYMSSLDVYVPFKSYYGEGDADSYYELATDWEPNQKGRDMPAADAERDMLAVLKQWPHEVCFSLDYHHHAQSERTWNMPDTRRATEWIAHFFRPNEVQKPEQLPPKWERKVESV